MTRIAFAAMAAALLAVPAAAHRGHSSLSVVEIDDRTGGLRVTHRMAAHDVEPALRDIAPNAQPSVDDPVALDALVCHAGRTFVISDASGQPVTLVPAGSELAGDDVRLVFSGRLPAPADALTVDSGLLEDSHQDQENQVNIRRSGVTRTIVFRRGSPPQRVAFP